MNAADKFEIVILIGLLAWIFGLMTKWQIADCKRRKKEREFERDHPLYMQFLAEHFRMREDRVNLWIALDRRKERVDECLRQMRYYPEDSEEYQYYVSELEKARERVVQAQREYDEKKAEVRDYVMSNKQVIEGIRDVKPGRYQDWLDEYPCLK